MKKILVSFLIIFSSVFNVFSIDIYKLDSASVKVYNQDMKDCTDLNVWQPLQKVNGTIKIDKMNNTIELCVINKTIFTINRENIFTHEYDDLVVTSYLFSEDLILFLYKKIDSYYFYINDTVNQIEVYYKINKVEI